MRSFSASALATFAIIGLSAGLAGCGGTQTVGAAPATAIPNSATETSSTTASTTFPLIGVSGDTETLVLPPTAPTGAVTETISTGAPSGVTPLAGLRAASGQRSTSAVVTTPIAYLELSTTVTLTVSEIPSFTFTLPSVTAGATYGLAVTSGDGYVPTGQTATVSGNTISFPSIAGSFTLTAGSPITFVLYTSTGSAATATPSPSPVPSPSLAPASLQFDASNPNVSQNVTVSNAGTGAVSGVIACTPTTPTPSPSPSPVFSQGPTLATAGQKPNDGPAPAIQDTPTPSPVPTADPYAFVAQFTAGSTTSSVTPTNGTAVFAISGGDDIGTCTATFTTAGGTTLTAAIETDELTGGLYSIHRVKH